MAFSYGSILTCELLAYKDTRMKIAFVGKGGSGKSTVSWLISNTLADTGRRVLAVDADHNMDLTSNLGLDYEKLPQMQKTDKEFFDIVAYEQGKAFTSILDKDDASLPHFSVEPADAYTASIATNVADNISLINVGLGDPDVMHRGKCAHGLSGPLKYYLGFLDEKDAWVVIDSVAGVDMINYGLYAGIDAVIVVVEPHRNSIKVMEQILTLCKKALIPCHLIINKPMNNEFYKELTEMHKDNILGEIPLDEGFAYYDYSKLKEVTLLAAKNIITNINSLKRRGGLAAMREFHKIKAGEAEES